MQIYDEKHIIARKQNRGIAGKNRCQLLTSLLEGQIDAALIRIITVRRRTCRTNVRADIWSVGPTVNLMLLPGSRDWGVTAVIIGRIAVCPEPFLA